jgi:hypothetical protein
VFESRMLRKLLGPKRDQVTGGWTKLCNEELHDLCCAPDISRVIKSGRMIWAGHVYSMEGKKNTYRVLVGKHEGRRPLEDLAVHGRIILKWILKK